MKMWVNVDEPGKDYCQSFIYSINKKTGSEQKIWASKSAVKSVRTDLVGDNWLCVDIVSYDMVDCDESFWVVKNETKQTC